MRDKSEQLLRWHSSYVMRRGGFVAGMTKEFRKWWWKNLLGCVKASSLLTRVERSHVSCCVLFIHDETYVRWGGRGEDLNYWKEKQFWILTLSLSRLLTETTLSSMAFLIHLNLTWGFKLDWVLIGVAKGCVPRPSPFHYPRITYKLPIKKKKLN